MQSLVVVESPDDWIAEFPGVRTVSARDYLSDPRYSQGPALRVFNLCRSYRYQSVGYYVSLLAAARRHRPVPSVSTIQDLKSRAIVRVVFGDLDELIQRNLRRLQSDEFVLSVYFGYNLARQYDELSRQLYNVFPAPFLRGRFARRDDRWQLQSVQLVSSKDIPRPHRSFVVAKAKEHFARRAPPSRRPGARHDLAILLNPKEKEPPSNPRAIERFVRAARTLGFRTELLEPEDIGYLAEFDALFIRETTSVNHHTYRFARRAEAEGLVVIDDPLSIVRCTNKVFLAEVLRKARIRMPGTTILHRENLDSVARELEFPCILKAPDGAFSQGVRRADDEDSFRESAAQLLVSSELVVAQEFLPTEYDWRVGVIDGKPLYACKYHMAPKHWQIVNWAHEGRGRYGQVETLAIEDAPRNVVKTAVRAAKLIGNGLYGVDLKEDRGRAMVIEVNDNPSIEAGDEDRLLGEQLYRTIMGVFLERVEYRKRGSR